MHIFTRIRTPSTVFYRALYTSRLGISSRLNQSQRMAKSYILPEDIRITQNRLALIGDDIDEQIGYLLSYNPDRYLELIIERRDAEAKRKESEEKIRNVPSTSLMSTSTDTNQSLVQYEQNQGENLSDFQRTMQIVMR